MSPSTPARRPARSAPARKAPARAGTSPAAPKRRFPIALVAGAILAAGLIVAIVLTMGSSGDSAQTEEATCVSLRVSEGYSQTAAEAVCATVEAGAPTVTGQALPTFEATSGDPAIGLPIPEVNGSDFAGNPVNITRDGRAKMIVFVAHWCSVCQVEVPTIMQWLPGASIPQNVDLYSVTTDISRVAANYPPSAWLAREGWTLPLIVDDQEGTVAAAFGLSAFPYFVFVDAQGNVVERRTGGLPGDVIAARLAPLAGS